VVANVPAPLTIASIARTIGLTRQSVRSVTAELMASGLVAYAPNPHHRRAHLVVLTPQGAEVERAARARQVPWARALGAGLSARSIEETVAVLQTVLARLEQNASNASEEKEGS
jgi:DNA-binding MarR family transcriptional regulator